MCTTIQRSGNFDLRHGCRCQIAHQGRIFFFPQALETCNKGCGYYKAAEKYDDIEGDHDKNDSLSLCQHSCEDSFDGAKDKQLKLAWCHQGCENAIIKQEVEVISPTNLMDLLLGNGDDLFKALEGNDDHRHGGLTISFGMPRMVFDNSNDDFGFMDGHMGHMFRRMNSQMDQMLNSMKSSMSSMMSKDVQRCFVAKHARES